jgi:serine/threonine-protein kinase
MLAPGELIGGKLRVVRRIGAGGMGVVYEAMQLHLRRRVAVKVITAGTVEARARFMQEARALAQLPSEHIVQVLDVDTLPDGALYMIMEYLDGRDLKRELKRRGPLPVDEAVAYLTQACAGVSVAHAAGIVHRDLKPQNLFVTNLEGYRHVKLLDFGVAKFIDGSQDLTVSSDVVGTPTHLAPEQLEGGPVDGRTDIWGLGIVLFELLTGTTPFRRESVVATLGAIRSDAPRSVCELRADVPEDLAAVVARCLEKRPVDRFATADELVRAVEPYGTFDGVVTQSRRAPRGSSAPPMDGSGARLDPEALTEPPLPQDALDHIETWVPPAPPAGRATGASNEHMGVPPGATQTPSSPVPRLTPLWAWAAAACGAIALIWALTREDRAVPAPFTARTALDAAARRGGEPAGASPPSRPPALAVMAPGPSASVGSAPAEPAPAAAHRLSAGAHARPAARVAPSKAPAPSAPAEPTPAPASLAGDAVPMHL